MGSYAAPSAKGNDKSTTTDYLQQCRLRFGLQLQGQKDAAVANAAIIMMLEPLLTVVAAAFWYGERLPLQQILGGVLILLAQLWYRARTLSRLPASVRKRT